MRIFPVFALIGGFLIGHGDLAFTLDLGVLLVSVGLIYGTALGLVSATSSPPARQPRRMPVPHIRIRT
jgi:hypothetical protein